MNIILLNLPLLMSERFANLNSNLLIQKSTNIVMFFTILFYKNASEKGT